MEDDVNVVLSDMPIGIKEFVSSNSDMSYTIVLNARHSCETRLKAYHHAMQHIQNNDFDKDYSSDLIEAETHNDNQSKSHMI